MIVSVSSLLAPPLRPLLQAPADSKTTVVGRIRARILRDGASDLEVPLGRSDLGGVLIAVPPTAGGMPAGVITDASVMQAVEMTTIQIAIPPGCAPGTYLTVDVGKYPVAFRFFFIASSSASILLLLLLL